MRGAWDEAPGAVEGAEPLGTIKLGQIGRSLWRTTRHSKGKLRAVAALAEEGAKIAIGRSTLAAEHKDWRFTDPTWETNPVYHRIMQTYLAWAAQMNGLVDSAELEWRDEERARFFMSALVSGFAPTNSLVGNPAAIKHLFETAGRSGVSGVRNFISDARHNRGLPSQVKRGAFAVGADLAATPGAVVYRDEVCEVIQYAPSTEMIRERPVLMIPPQINKYYFMDLAPGRSFVEHAVAQGIPFFAISWRNPDKRHTDWDFDTYAAAVLRAIDVACRISRSKDVNLLGLCAGGILSAAVLAHLADTDDRRVYSASFGVTLLDFDSPASLGMFNSGPVLSIGKKKSSHSGILDGPSLGTVFTWMRPNDLVWNYWVNNFLMGKDPPSFDILAWNADSTNLPAALHHQFMEIFSSNTLTEPGAMRVLGTPIDLSRVEVDTYVTGATTDHLTPWKGCYRSTQLFGGSSTFVLSNAGHIASLINPPGNPKAHYFVGPEPGHDADAWRESATEQRGTWWEHWADWVLERSGGERSPGTKLGNRRHAPIEAAPGSYVRDIEPVAA